MRSLRWAGPVVACLVVLVAGPVRAQPFAGRVAEATGVVFVVGSDDQPYAVQLGLTGLTPAAGAPSYTLSLTVGRCSADGCRTGVVWVRQLTGRGVEVAADESTAVVRTTFMGRQLTAIWTAPAAGTQADANVQVLLPATAVRAGRGARPAQLRVSLLGASCPGAGQIDARYVLASDGYAAPDGPPPPSKAPPYLASSGPRKLTCRG